MFYNTTQYVYQRPKQGTNLRTELKMALVSPFFTKRTKHLIVVSITQMDITKKKRQAQLINSYETAFLWIHNKVRFPARARFLLPFFRLLGC